MAPRTKFVRPARRTQRAADAAGFTLVELMVVLVIIGLASAAVVLALPGTNASLAGEAERFAARAKAARDAAIVEGRPIRLAVDGAGYRVEHRRGGEWRIQAEHGWTEGTQVQPVSDASAFRFDATGVAEPGTLRLARDGHRVDVEIGHDGAIQIHR